MWFLNGQPSNFLPSYHSGGDEPYFVWSGNEVTIDTSIDNGLYLEWETRGPEIICAWCFTNREVQPEMSGELGTQLVLLKYKVELPIGAKVTLFDDESLEVQFLSWDIPCPTSLQSMTFLQVKAANGFEKQMTPSAGSQTIELWTELGRRYAVFAEIWTYSFAQVLWFADLKVQLSNYEWQDVVPTAGEGGTIVTALPQ